MKAKVTIKVANDKDIAVAIRRMEREREIEMFGKQISMGKKIHSPKTNYNRQREKKVVFDY